MIVPNNRGRLVTITIRAVLTVCARLALAFGTSLMAATPVRAADWTLRPVEHTTPTFKGDVGFRFWYGTATTAKNLYDTSGSVLISRLTYGDLQVYSGELYGRFDYDRGWFLKAYAGGGGFKNGNLRDEDFPPVIAPYSSTFSIEQNGAPAYGSIDLGFDFVRGGDFRIGAFGGYHFLNIAVNAYGCAQNGNNPSICGVFPIPQTVKAISQDNNWHSVRVGLDASVEINRLKLSVEAAWLPYVRLEGADTHWLRIGTAPGDFYGPIPEDGKGWGYQLEGFVSYRVTEAVSLGIGGRYWSMRTRGHTHFENNIVGGGGAPQVLDWKIETYGVYLQTSVKFGPYPLAGF